MDESAIKNILEALLMTHGEPLSLEKMRASFEEKPSLEQLRRALQQLAADYEPRAIELLLKPSGYCIQSKSCYSPWIVRLLTEKPLHYSPACLETLAIIAYKQPVTCADIEATRGVAVNRLILKTLLERGWIEIIGRRDAPGRPVVYGTSKTFLDDFNLTSLVDLPSLQPSTVNE